MKVSACGKNASCVVENTRSASTPGLGAPGFGVLASCGPLLLALLDTSTILRAMAWLLTGAGLRSVLLTPKLAMPLFQTLLAGRAASDRPTGLMTPGTGRLKRWPG